jgi:pectinesterase
MTNSSLLRLPPAACAPIATFATFANFATFAICAICAALPAHGAERLHITVSHSLDAARASETISVPWSEVNKALPGALLQKIAVKDAKGRLLPYQVTNVAPQAKDPHNQGIAYGELIFQHDFKRGERRASFTVEKTDKPAPVFPNKVFARYIPERLDDFAWENDKVAHRAYGPALSAPAPAGTDKEVLETSGIDVWFKRVPYPIVDRWYNKGHDHYHVDEGEGMDMHQVGRTRGNGGTGVWDGAQLYVGANYKTWKVLANGPVRAIFELSYDAWDARLPGGAAVKVSEVKRFTIDAGHYLRQMDSTFTFSGAQELTVAVGLTRTPTDKGQEPQVAVLENRADPSLGQWVTQKSNGAFGTAVIIPGQASYTADAANLLMLAQVRSSQPLRYYVGAAWDRAGEITSARQWQAHIANAAARARAPLTVTLSSTK